MRTNKIGFTLLELLIVIGIVGLLSVVLFRTYATVSQITFRLQSEKNLMGEVFSVSQIIQNISEKSTIDYSKYSNLEATNGVVDVLYLTGGDGAFSLTTKGTCTVYSADLTGFNQKDLADPCMLVMDRADGTQISLTQSGLVQLTKVQFKVIPFVANEQVLGEENQSTKQVFLRLRQPGFWMFFTAYSPSFSSFEWTRRVSLSFQQFFNLK